MNTLSVNVGREDLAEVLKGEVKGFGVEVTPENMAQLVQLDEKGHAKRDADGHAIPVAFDSVGFYAINGAKEQCVVVEVVTCHAELMKDDKGRLITYKHGGRDMMAEQVTFELGRIIENGSIINRRTN